jgi:DNA sulfur modification protein DndC
MFQEIKASLRQLYLEDKRPWLVGFSGGKDSTMLASLIFDAVLSIPAEQRKKPISVFCTDSADLELTKVKEYKWPRQASRWVHFSLFRSTKSNRI